jgi:hypothetical protein
MVYTLPARVVLDTFCSALDAQRKQLHRQQRHGPSAGQVMQIDKLSEQIHLCGPMLQDNRLGQVPEVDAVAASLLCDWVSGDMTALKMLEERLAELKHPAAGRVAELEPWQLAEGVRLVIFG